MIDLTPEHGQKVDPSLLYLVCGKTFACEPGDVSTVNVNKHSNVVKCRHVGLPLDGALAMAKKHQWSVADMLITGSVKRPAPRQGL